MVRSAHPVQGRTGTVRGTAEAMRRHVVVGLAALLPLVAAAPAVADPGSPLGSPVYLALGDSVPAGVGALPDAPGYPTLL